MISLYVITVVIGVPVIGLTLLGLLIYLICQLAIKIS